MKRYTVYSLFLMSVLVIFSCTKDVVKVDDPVGTITQSINYTVGGMSIILYQGLDEDTFHYVPYVQIKVGIRDASLNFSFDDITATDINIINWIYIGHGMGGEIVDVGEVNGLGNVTEKPSAGWSGLAAVQVGHGYVVRYKNTFNYSTADLPYYYGRLYVEDWLTATTGGVIGATVKYQLPF
jgi:hypothetical protein